jgi:hypothetical protein
MQVTYAKRAKRNPEELGRHHAMHVAASLIGAAAFFLEETVPSIPYTHGVSCLLSFYKFMIPIVLSMTRAF